jgi:transglutaminase-like putative cysteine protease
VSTRYTGWIGRVPGVDYRLAALAGAGALTAAYGSVLYHVADVVGGSRLMLAVLCGTVVLALAVGQVLRPRTAAALTALLLVGGTAIYVLSVPASQRAILSVDRVLSDTVALLTGLSVLRLTRANVWALSVAPPPIFLSWYLLVRRRYAAGVGVGFVMLVLFVLTGDASDPVTLVGAVGAAAAVGFGTLDRYGGTAGQVETLVIVLATIIVVAAVAPTAVGTGTGSVGRGPLLLDRASPTGQASLIDATDRVEIVGPLSLSPRVQFTVESETRTYWQTATYDRYTGSGWVQSGETSAYEGRLPAPESAEGTARQTVTAETEMGAMPAAWKPVEISDLSPDRVTVLPDGSVRPSSTIEPGESYSVISRLPRTPPADRQTGDAEYPDAVVERYTTVPDSTPDRVARRSAEVTADADTPAEAAAAVESHLEATKEYSLSVERPDGDVADAFLFEMTAGYCTYYATAMVTMLRTQGIPARFVTGYTPGQQVEDDGYVVRGLDSHAWVQVYLPDAGWVRYDPTPAGPRREAEQSRLASARESGEAGVDTTGSNGTSMALSTATPQPDENETTATGTANASQEPGGVPEGGREGAMSDGGGPDLPPVETLALWGIVLAGAATVIRRTSVITRARRAVWLRRRGSRAARDPDADAVRAFERLAYLLERQHRPRRPGETPRAYVDALADDERATVVCDAYERALYGDGIDRATADAATDAVDDLVRERTLPTRPFVDARGAETERPDTV